MLDRASRILSKLYGIVGWMTGHHRPKICHIRELFAKFLLIQNVFAKFYVLSVFMKQFNPAQDMSPHYTVLTALYITLIFRIN